VEHLDHGPVEPDHPVVECGFDRIAGLEPAHLSATGAAPQGLGFIIAARSYGARPRPRAPRR
jgi:hypothetical protein